MPFYGSFSFSRCCLVMWKVFLCFIFSSSFLNAPSLKRKKKKKKKRRSKKAQESIRPIENIEKRMKEILWQIKIFSRNKICVWAELIRYARKFDVNVCACARARIVFSSPSSLYRFLPLSLDIFLYPISMTKKTVALQNGLISLNFNCIDIRMLNLSSFSYFRCINLVQWELRKTKWIGKTTFIGMHKNKNKSSEWIIAVSQWSANRSSLVDWICQPLKQHLDFENIIKKPQKNFFFVSNLIINLTAVFNT